jgi:hypothetical protein
MGLWRLAKTAIFSFSAFPLTLFYAIGYLSFAVFAGLAGFSLFCRFATDLAVPGWTSTVLVASFFGAINAMGISILGEYVIRIYDQVRGRPLYLVERSVNLAPNKSSSEPAEWSLAAGSGDLGPAFGDLEQALWEETSRLAELTSYQAVVGGEQPMFSP